MALIIPWRGKVPQIADDAFIAPNATIIGDVVIGSKASIWFNCVLRGDVEIIRIGARTNIQDGTIIHVDSGGSSTIIGDDVLVGHKAMLHGCILQDRSFVGMCATLLDRVVVETDAMVAACALITPGKTVARGQLWAGSPARHLRDVKPEEITGTARGVAHYAERGAEMRAQLTAMDGAR